MDEIIGTCALKDGLVGKGGVGPTDELLETTDPRGVLNGAWLATVGPEVSVEVCLG